MISSLSNTRLLSSMGWWFFPSNGSQIPYSDGGRRFEQVGLTISVVLLGPSFYQEGWIEVRSRIKLPKSTPLCCKMCYECIFFPKKLLSMKVIATSKCKLLKGWPPAWLFVLPREVPLGSLVKPNTGETSHEDWKTSSQSPQDLNQFVLFPIALSNN